MISTRENRMSESIPIVAGGIPPFPDFEVAESVFDRDMMAIIAIKISVGKHQKLRVEKSAALSCNSDFISN
jgi:hypothetical protein